ncbi:hypothetical protein DAEQUDRAFT_722941 [Daedalea quercina L-15889]|uniref:Protein kinase domain-containing protein n=1 Tax=Daedalea quercina L-15889 TaxID=1314783 RepID=A0A165SP03_9APHY|nr:hypothetical protein DAEQUDRAFT_722941 [Daedalea quercina L-15889]
MRFTFLLSLLSCLVLFVCGAPVNQRVLAIRELHDLIQRSPEFQDALVRLWRRNDIVIKLEGKEYHLSLHSKQGNSGSPVYIVTSANLRGDFAKTSYSSNEFIATEAAGEVAAHGRASDGKQWMIIKKSPGMHITDTTAYKTVKGHQAKCEELLHKAANLAAKETVALWQKTHGWDQNDPNVENVLFDDHMTKAYLIDWGMAKKTPHAPSEAAVQAESLRMFSASGLCKTIPPPPKAPPKKKH